jgi:hypothetical protein
VPAIVYGRIVYPLVPLPDPQGRNPKEGRPFVVISTPQQIQEGCDIELVGITSELSSSPAEDYAPIPWGHCATTRLTKKSAALCTWRVTLSQSDVEAGRGIVPPRYVEEIRTKVERGTC